MKLVSIILGALTLGMCSFAAPVAESDSTLSNLVYHWHGCGAGILVSVLGTHHAYKLTSDSVIQIAIVRPAKIVFKLRRA